VVSYLSEVFKSVGRSMMSVSIANDAFLRKFRFAKLDLFWGKSLLPNLRRKPRDNAVAWHVLGDNGTSGDDGTRADGHARENEGAPADLDIVLNHYPGAVTPWCFEHGLPRAVSGMRIARQKTQWRPPPEDDSG
jgi:hypothetical protein